MSEIIIYGASDDLLEVKGDISKEWGCFDEGEIYVVLSSSAIISIEYNGEWKIKKHQEPRDGSVTIHAAGSEKAREHTSRGYSDAAVIDSDEEIEWVVKGDCIEKAQEGLEKSSGDCQ